MCFVFCLQKRKYNSTFLSQQDKLFLLVDKRVWKSNIFYRGRDKFC